MGENWIISCSSDREASGASATLWLGMRVMALLSRRAAARGRGTVTGKDGAAAGSVTGGPVPLSHFARLIRPSRAEPRQRPSHGVLRKDLHQ